MKSIISKTIALVAVAVTLLSFKANFGGEGFQISLNGKLVLERYGKNMDAIQTLALNSAAPDDQLSIHYYHCGKVAKNRVVTIKDGHDKVLKEWRFKDVQKPMGEMSCSVKELLGLKKNGEKVLKLYYSSSELPEGRQLAAVALDSKQQVTAGLLIIGLPGF